MNETQAKIYDIDVLERRIAVSDRELAFMLGVGVSTARRIASEANAVCRVGTRKLNEDALQRSAGERFSGAERAGIAGNQ